MLLPATEVRIVPLCMGRKEGTEGCIPIKISLGLTSTISFKTRTINKNVNF